MIEEINSLQEQIDVLVEKSHSIWKDVEELNRKRNELLYKYILKNGILTELDWEFTNSYYLNCKQSSWDIDFFKEFLEDDKNYELLPGVYLELWNGGIKLYFRNTEDMLFSIKKLNLKVSGEKIEQEIQELETKLTELKSIYGRYKCQKK